MSLQRIDYNHKRTWTITENNAIGPTTSSTLRTLTTATPTNLNAYFVAPNGNDGGAGSDVDPFLTISVALNAAIASATRNTVHIIRNGYVGALSFAGFSAAKNLNSKTIVLQVALEETATIAEMNIGQNVAGVGTLKLNGLQVDKLTVFQITGSVQFESYFCDITCFDIRTILCTLQNSIFRKHASFNLDANTLGTLFNVQYCIFFEIPLYLSTPGANGFGHCVFYGQQILFTNALLSASTLAIANSIISQIGTLLSVSTNLTTYISYSLVPREYTGVTTMPTCLVGYQPLFFDADNADFRLMDERRTAPYSDDYFEITSKAAYYPEIGYDISSDNKDVGVYDVSYVEDFNTWKEFEFDNEYWNNEVNIENELINYQTFTDVRGNFHRAFDNRKRKITLNTVQNSYIGTVDSYHFAEMLETEGAKRWFPRGDLGIWSGSGTFSTTDAGDYSVVLSTISDLRENAYKGFIVLCSSGALPSDFYLQILNNSSGSLTLTDHRGYQSINMPASGTLNLICQYLPIEIDMGTMTMNFTNWNPEENPLYPTSTEYESWEGHIRELVLREVEDDE